MTANYSRRSFLSSLAVLPATSFAKPATSIASDIRIQSIEVFPLVYPMTGRFKFFEDPAGKMQGRASVVVKITASDGTTGWGQSVPIPRWSYETLHSVSTTIQHYFTPMLLGHDVFDIHGAHEKMNRAIAPSFNMGQPMARAGVDIALHDIIGKRLNLSLPQLWGRSAISAVNASWTLNPKKPDDVDRLIDEGWAQGCRNFNVKVSPDPTFDLDLCRRVKQRVPDGFLWADANGGYDLATAKWIAPRLADIGVNVLEQPLPANNISGYQSLKKQGALPILMDEGIVSPSTLIELIRLDALDGVAMKPARCGGLYPALRQIQILEDAGLMILGSGLTDPDISLAATLALYGAIHYHLPAALNGPQFIHRSILHKPFTIQNGHFYLPADSGLGVQVDERKLRQLVVKL